MKTVIYVDELITVNLFVTYLLILACERITGIRVSLRRRLLGAVAGAVVSLAVFIPSEGFLVTFAVNALGSLLIVFASFFPWTAKSFVKLYLAFFSVSFLFAGAVLAVCCTFSPGKMLSRNGVVYFDVDVLLIVSLTAICYGLLTIGEYLLKKRTVGNTVFDVTVKRAGRVQTFRALYDTGMSLSDVFSGRPAVVTGLEKAKKLLSEEESAFFRDGSFEKELPASLRGSFRIISCSTLGGESVFGAFLADEVRSGDEFTKEVYIAVSPRLNSAGEYDMLIGGTVLRERIERANDKV